MVLLIEFLDLPEKFAVVALRQNLCSGVPASVAEMSKRHTDEIRTAAGGHSKSRMTGDVHLSNRRLYCAEPFLDTFHPFVLTQCRQALRDGLE